MIDYLLKRPINLVLLKSTPLQTPYVLDDTVLSVQNMLVRAGFETHLSYNAVDPRVTNILFGIQMPGTASIAQIRNLTAQDNAIIFNSQQLSSTSPWVTPEYLELLREHVCLDYSLANVQYLQNHSEGDISAFEFPLLPSQEFRRDFPLDASRWQIQYDLAFYGTTSNGGRMERLQELARQGISLKCFAGAYGRLLTPEILECSAVLNIHGYDAALFEVGRCLRPLAMGIPIFSDISNHPGIVNWADSGIFFIPRDNFTNTVAQWLRESDRMLEASQRLTAFVNDLKWPELARTVMNKALMALAQK